MARPKLDDPRSIVVHFRLNGTEAEWMDDLVRKGRHKDRSDLLRTLLYAEIKRTPRDAEDGDLYDE